MNILLDNLSAVMIGSMVLLVVIGSQVVGTNSNVDQTGYFAARAQTYAFGDQLQDDFENFGFGVPGGTNVVQTNTSTQIRFWRQLDPSVPTLSSISYQISVSDTIKVDGTATPVFTLNRTVDGVSQGGGPGNLTAFTFEFRDEDNNVVVSEADAYSIHIRFSVVPYYSETPALNSIYWSRTFRINNA